VRVHVVCRADQMDWILGKIAQRLRRELEPLVPVSLGPEPDASADLNHFVWYDDYREGGPATIGITHIDSVRKLELVRAQLRTARAGICLSRQHRDDLVHAGLPRERLGYVTPAHDALLAPRRIHVGITTRLYTPDPCKREWMLEELGRHLDPADFCFTIMGAGWDDIVSGLRARGLQVTWHPAFDPDVYQRIVPSFDYYLYLGWDEGSMGFLDALHAGVPTIATPQGFHLDVPGGLTHRIDTQASLLAVFEELAREKRARTASVSALTWSGYARKHLDIWHHLLAPGRAPTVTGAGDGLASLLEPGPARDALRGKAFLAELERVDQLREELARAYEARGA
jgi:hypothetical protein